MEEQEQRRDELYCDAVRITIENGHVTIPLLQQQLDIERSRAAAIIAMMEQEGIVRESEEGLVIDQEFLARREILSEFEQE